MCDCILALKLLDAQALLARCARVILADLRLPLDLCAETGARCAKTVDLGEEIPVGSIFPSSAESEVRLSSSDGNKIRRRSFMVANPLQEYGYL